MKIKNVVAALALGTVLMGSTSVGHAEYITALEEYHYEKYVVDTDSLYYPDPKHKFDRFNCLIWFYEKPDQQKGKPYTLQYKFEDNTWKMAEKVTEKDGKEKLVWDKLEENSVASNVLRIVLPFIGHSAVDTGDYKKKS